MNVILHTALFSDWDCCGSSLGSPHDLHNVWPVVQEQEVCLLK